MKILMIFAQGPPVAQLGGPWTFAVLVLLILFVTLVVTEGSKNKDQ
ncbi:MAG TPA: hypothetical protein VL970_06285 [Candidatus Acidoferrales bacterium]|nr:hypothetical protein [Candidatus Acidoferrales bacterium]